MAQRWAVLVHCVLVIISMFGMAAALVGKSASLATLGFLSFFVFGITEILRTSLSIFAVNRTWRSGYAAADDDRTRQMFRDLFTSSGGVNDALFFVFYTAFVIGLLCYGAVLVRTPGYDRWMGILFVLWAAVNLPVFIDTIRATEHLGGYFEWVGPYFQPIARIAIGFWLWQFASRVNERPPASVI
jgi:hypothetical protein